ncbi:MAG: enoyl-CoA hydratase/isomerase family protein [Chloroflexota bacterium]|nr:MAG: enoyl-CoA hydratase/isomerase family protein [Chloroflexota bacterium]
MSAEQRTYPEYQTLLCKRDGPVLVVTMNRPHKLNAADVQMYLDLEDLMPRIGADPDVRAVVLHGSGDRSFAAGDDISVFRWEGVAGSLGFIDLVQWVFILVERCPKPIVGAVQGFALGFGFEIALACDVVIAATNARFGLPEITVGAVPINTVTHGLEILRRRVVAYLAMTGDEWLNGEQAVTVGMAHLAVPPERLMPEAVALAHRMADWPPAAVKATKVLLNRTADLHYLEAVDIMPSVMYDEEVREGRAAFLEKRKAQFPTILTPTLD